MNRSFRAQESQMPATVRQRQPQVGSLRSSVMKEKEEELTLFLEMRKREKERSNLLLLQNSEEFDAPLGANMSNPFVCFWLSRFLFHALWPSLLQQIDVNCIGILVSFIGPFPVSFYFTIFLHLITNLRLLLIILH